jgi:hypothetical protein
MVGLIIEFCLVVGWFLWLRRRELRDRDRGRRVPPRQMDLDLEEED